MNEKQVIEYLKSKRDEIIKNSLINRVDVGDKVYAIDIVIRILNASDKAPDK